MDVEKVIYAFGLLFPLSPSLKLHRQTFTRFREQTTSIPAGLHWHPVIHSTVTFITYIPVFIFPSDFFV